MREGGKNKVRSDSEGFSSSEIRHMKYLSEGFSFLKSNTVHHIKKIEGFRLHRALVTISSVSINRKLSWGNREQLLGRRIQARAI
jgi:hypothetical protein